MTDDEGDRTELIGVGTPAAGSPAAETFEQLRPCLVSVPVLTLLTGVLFPAVLALPCRLLFPDQSDGSLVVRNGVVVGSALIGQANAAPGAFHPRPSAAGAGYDGVASGGANLGPSNPKLRDGAPDDRATPGADESFEGVRQLAEGYRRRNGLGPGATVPADAVTRSGSGLDPHISPENAALQVARVARERGLGEAEVRRIVAGHTRGPQLGVFGAPRVSVLDLNLALDRASAPASPPPAR